VGLGTELAPSALVLVLVKSHRTAAIAQAAAVSALPEGVIVTLQNGLGNRERLADAAGSERVAAGVAYLGATSLAPGEVRAGGGARVVIEAHPRAQGAVEALSVAGFVVERVADMAPAIWLKLATNCAINPLSALTGAVNGALPEDPERCATLRAAALEVGTVAARLGVRLEQDPAEAVVELARATAHNRSSMLADVARGAPTEIEALNGAVLRIAEQLGLDLPVNRRLVEAMRALPPAMCPC
jgi:2-dehydropantoate 2-reductase